MPVQILSFFVHFLHFLTQTDFFLIKCRCNKNKGGQFTMSKLKMMIQKFIPGIIACLTLVLSINANTASCGVFHQPEEPKAMDKFKMFK